MIKPSEGHPLDFKHPEYPQRGEEFMPGLSGNMKAVREFYTQVIRA
jgi:hypothetical protein